MSDESAGILPPSIDPKTRKIGIRKVRAVNDGGTETVSRVRDFEPVHSDEPAELGGTNRAPSPLELALVSLVSCDGVIINGVAKAMGFDYSQVEFECSSQIDVRGPKGVKGIRPYFETVDLKITVTSPENEQRFATLQKNVEFRCPVMNLFKAADVEMNVTWTLKTPK